MSEIEPSGKNRRAWTGPIPVLSPGDWPDGPGLYRVVAIRDGERLSLDRLCGKDADGILYIGRASGTDGLRSRLQALNRAWAQCENREEHQSAKRFYRNRALTTFFKVADIFVEYRDMPFAAPKEHEYVASDPELDSASDLASAQVSFDAATLQERDELWRYEQRYGELPPLNSREGDRLK